MKLKTNPSVEVLVLDGSPLMNAALNKELPKLYKAELEKSGLVPVIFDLSTINNIFSYGVALIVGLSKECKKRNREFSVKIENENLSMLFKMLKLDRIVTIRKSGETA